MLPQSDPCLVDLDKVKLIHCETVGSDVGPLVGAECVGIVDRVGARVAEGIGEISLVGIGELVGTNVQEFCDDFCLKYVKIVSVYASSLLQVVFPDVGVGE